MELTKRAWRIVQVIYFMIRKGISKSKLLLDLNLLLKRGNKIASKALHNLIKFHPNNNNPMDAMNHDHEYEFSCSNTPKYSLPFHLSKRHHHHHQYGNFFGCAFQKPETRDDEVATMNAVRMALEMLNNNNNEGIVEASPYLPGFGRTPMARQLRITDSPFPLRDDDDEDKGYVDKKAEEFIEKFYRELRKQSS